MKQMVLLLYKAIPRPVRSFGALVLGKCLGRRWFWDLESLVKPRDSILSGCTDEAEFAATGERDAAFMQSLELIDAESVTLHIGCGMGRIEKHLAEHVSAAHGIDISRVMIRRARHAPERPLPCE